MQLVVAARQLPDQPFGYRQRRGDIADKKRTSSSRLSSAMATACFVFDGSNATEPSPPRMRLGASPPVQPSLLYCMKGRVAGPSRLT
jgi:hypothetical protein